MFCCGLVLCTNTAFFSTLFIDLLYLIFQYTSGIRDEYKLNNAGLGSGGTVHGWKNTPTWPLGKLVMEADHILYARTDHWEWATVSLV